MVKVNAPAMSLDASGSLGGAIVFSKWKGRNYIRTLVRPSNPKSELQVAIRAMFKFMAQAWATVGGTPRGTWDDLAKAGAFSTFNAYQQAGMRRWREFQPPSQSSPAEETGTPPEATLDSATGGSRHCDVTFTITTLNDVWGVAIFRSTSTGFTPSLANCIAVLPVDSTGTLVYTDSQLTPGDYFYDAKFFTKEGLFGADEGEVTDTVDA